MIEPAWSRVAVGPRRLACLIAVLLLTPANALAQRDAFAHAIADLTTAIEGTYGDDGEEMRAALDRMSAALAAWDRDIEAATAGVRAAAQDPPSRLADKRIALGRLYADRGRLAEALAEFDAVRRLDARRADVQVLRGLVLQASGQRVEAIVAFRTARALAPGDPTIAYYLFHEAWLNDDSEAAREGIEALATAYAALLKAPPGRKTTPFARIALLQPGSSRPPLLPLAAYSQAYRQLGSGQYEGAIAEFRTIAATDPLVSGPTATSPSMRRAMAAFRQGKFAEARSLLEQSGPLADSPETHRILGLIHWADSNYDKSIAELSDASRRAPADERARLALSRVLTAAGRDADAERVLVDTLRVLPGSALAHWWLASTYERLNRFVDARREAESAAAMAVAGEDQLYGAVGRLTSGAEFSTAINAFARAVSVNPNDAATHRVLAVALTQQDRADEALAEFIAAVLIDPQDAEAHIGIGQIHLNAGRLTDAATVLRRATELAPANAEARYALASALTRLGRPDEAAPHFARAEQLQRQALADRRRTLTHDVLKGEAGLRVAEGRFDAAIALLEQSLAVAPDPSVYRQLADLYLRVGRGPDAARARALYEQAVRPGTPREPGR